MPTPPFHLCDAQFPSRFGSKLEASTTHQCPSTTSENRCESPAMTSTSITSIPTPVVTRSAKRRWSERLCVAVVPLAIRFFEQNFLGDINVTRRITMVERYIYIYTYNYIYIYIMYVYTYLHLLLIGAVCSTQLLWPFIRFLRHLGGPLPNMVTSASSPDLPNLWSQIWVAEDFGVSSLQFLIECKRSWFGPKSMKMMLLFEAISSSRNYPVSVMWDCSTSLP